MTKKEPVKYYAYVLFDGKLYRNGDMMPTIPAGALYHMITTFKPDLTLEEALAAPPHPLCSCSAKQTDV